MKAGWRAGHRRTRPAAQSGFTLIELLVAIGIATVVVLAAYTALTSGLTVYNRVGSASEEVQVVRALVDRLTRELQATYFNSQAPDSVFLGEEAEGTMGTSGSTGATSSTSGGTAGASGASTAPGMGVGSGGTLGNSGAGGGMGATSAGATDNAAAINNAMASTAG